MDFKSGDTVIVKKPEDWMSSISGKITNRVGVVRFIRQGDGAVIVDFPANGRRKLFTHHFRQIDLEPTP